jgi:divalent metal cation (Fe/Co/Zn/Cd) transporter
MKLPANKWLRLAFYLSLVTFIYNLAEGIFSIHFGIGDDTLALMGFGADSFVEVISGIGILHMIIRMNHSDVKEHDRFERQALRITGTSFYLLTIGLLAGVAFNLVRNSQPDTTLAGIIISVLSIFSMYFLYHYKMKAGKNLHSEAIISDANCTKTCLYLSLVLFASSTLFEFTGISYIDLAGSMGIAWFAFSEGREAFEKVRENKIACSFGDCH